MKDRERECVREGDRQSVTERERVKEERQRVRVREKEDEKQSGREEE